MCRCKECRVTDSSICATINSQRSRIHDYQHFTDPTDSTPLYEEPCACSKYRWSELPPAVARVEIAMENYTLQRCQRRMHTESTSFARASRIRISELWEIALSTLCQSEDWVFLHGVNPRQ